MELKDRMYRIVSTEEGKVRLELLPDHPIYQAHFPGNPITPGVCIIKIIAELLECRIGRPVVLSKIVNLKFIAPISPVSDPVVDVVFSAIDQQGDDVKAKGCIFIGDRTVTKFSVIYHQQ